MALLRQRRSGRPARQHLQHQGDADLEPRRSPRRSTTTSGRGCPRSSARSCGSWRSRSGPRRATGTWPWSGFATGCGPRSRSEPRDDRRRRPSPRSHGGSRRNDSAPSERRRGALSQSPMPDRYREVGSRGVRGRDQGEERDPEHHQHPRPDWERWSDEDHDRRRRQHGVGGRFSTHRGTWARTGF